MYRLCLSILVLCSVNVFGSGNSLVEWVFYNSPEERNKIPYVIQYCKSLLPNDPIWSNTEEQVITLMQFQNKYKISTFALLSGYFCSDFAKQERYDQLSLKDKIFWHVTQLKELCSINVFGSGDNHSNNVSAGNIVDTLKLLDFCIQSNIPLEDISLFTLSIYFCNQQSTKVKEMLKLALIINFFTKKPTSSLQSFNNF